jgi:hypothetical protein
VYYRLLGIMVGKGVKGKLRKNYNPKHFLSHGRKIEP